LKFGLRKEKERGYNIVNTKDTSGTTTVAEENEKEEEEEEEEEKKKPSVPNEVMLSHVRTTRVVTKR